MLLGNRHLFLLCVRWQVDDVQAVSHRRGNRPGVGRRSDPQDAGEIEGNAEVGVRERRPLRRVQDTEQRIGVRVRVADRVEPLEDEKRVVHPGLAQTRDHTAGSDVAPGSMDLPLGRLPVEGDAHRRSAEGLRDGARERRLAGPAAAGEAENERLPLNRSRADDQRGQPVRRVRASARTGTLEGQQVARLGARPQEPKDPGLGTVEGGVGAAEQLLHVRPVEPLGLGLHPRQVEHCPNPVQRRLGRPGAAAEHASQPVRQRLLHGARQTGAIERPDGLSDARAGREETTLRVEPGSAGCRGVKVRNGLGGTAREEFGRRAGLGGRVVEQVERAWLVHGNRAGGHRQVGESPQMALPRRRNQVGCVSRLAYGRRRVAVPGRRKGAAEGIERLAVLVERGRVDKLDRHLVSPPQQLRAHACVLS